MGSHTRIGVGLTQFSRWQVRTSRHCKMLLSLWTMLIWAITAMFIKYIYRHRVCCRLAMSCANMPTLTSKLWTLSFALYTNTQTVHCSLFGLSVHRGANQNLKLSPPWSPPNFIQVSFWWKWISFFLKINNIFNWKYATKPHSITKWQRGSNCAIFQKLVILFL